MENVKDQEQGKEMENAPVILGIAVKLVPNAHKGITIHTRVRTLLKMSRVIQVNISYLLKCKIGISSRKIKYSSYFQTETKRFALNVTHLVLAHVLEPDQNRALLARKAI